MIELLLFATLIYVAADVLFGALSLAIVFSLWRQEVNFKRKYSYSDPKGFFEFRAWLNRPSQR